jgi:CDP-diacylglycerol--glycerol-3-phosphate 3-phosphatidyltransferase
MKNQTWTVGIPWTLASARAALAPVMMLGAACHWNGPTMAGMVVAALLSDIFDGMLARRWGTDTAALRLLDSMADTVFYLGVAAALGIAQPDFWRSNESLLLAVLGLEACRFALDFAKFGKPASYHSYLAKTWGLVLASAVVTTFATGHTSWPMRNALMLGVVQLTEGIVMSIIIPVWSRDVKTLGAAWKIRRECVSSARLASIPAIAR